MGSFVAERLRMPTGRLCREVCPLTLPTTQEYEFAELEQYQLSGRNEFHCERYAHIRSGKALLKWWSQINDEIKQRQLTTALTMCCLESALRGN